MDYAVKQLSLEPPIPIQGRKQVALRALEILLGLFMVIASGAPKLFGVDEAVKDFDKIGWGDWFRYVVGAFEVIVGILLILPKTTRLASILFSIQMVFAFIFAITVLEYGGQSVTPVILFVIFALIAWARRAA
jgi:uncharacterized membrane protein YphA (DoxX/SURF4 family)